MTIRFNIRNLAVLLAMTLLISLPVPARADETKQETKHDPKAQENPPSTEPVKKVTVEEFDKKRTEKGAVVLDVRSPKEYADGHVPGAVNLNVQDKDFKDKVAKLDKSKTYLVHCARGGRSALATSQMSDLGFKSLFDFSGGMKAWEKAGKPVEKKTPDEKPEEKKAQK